MATANHDFGTAVVIDSGSYNCKVGFAGSDVPTKEFPSVVGRPKYDGRMAGLTKWETYIGDIAHRKRAILNLKYPIERGVVVDWDDMEKVWHHAFCNELRVSPEEHPVFMTDSPLNPKSNRESMAQIIFEKFAMQGFHVCLQAILSMFASGRNCGVVLDCGDGVTQVLGLTEGHYSITSSVRRIDLAGSDLTKYLATLLRQNGYGLTNPSHYEIVRDIKQKHCFVALNYEEEGQNNREPVQYELPDGQVITINNERFRCSEVMFQPSFIGLEHKGVHELVYESLMACDVDLRSDLMVNFIISGGTTMLPGFPERLRKELRQFTPHNRRVSVVALPYRHYSAWIGGSILSDLSFFEKVWITKAQYEEEGPGIVHRRCN